MKSTIFCMESTILGVAFWADLTNFGLIWVDFDATAARR